MNFIKKLRELLRKEKTNNPKTLEQMYGMGFISKEEFLRFTIVRKGISLEKAETELKDFLNKRIKKRKK
jgi:hypothetical protein